MNSPLKFFLNTEGPDKDPTWLQVWANDATRLAMKHFLDLAQGVYKPEIKGALSQPKAERYNLEQFHRAQRVETRFFNQFRVAYDSLLGRPQERPEANPAGGATEAATADGATRIGEEMVSEDNKKIDSTPSRVTAFQLECEAKCREAIDARVVLLVAEATGTEIHASVTTSRLYERTKARSSWGDMSSIPSPLGERCSRSTCSRSTCV